MDLFLIMIYFGGAVFEYRYQRDAMQKGRTGSLLKSALWVYELGYLICAVVNAHTVAIKHSRSSQP